jgi:hypothetical protein
MLFFDNSVCLGCGASLGFVPETLVLDVVSPAARRCAMSRLAECNWIVADDDPNRLCVSCRLTRTRPNDTDTAAMAAFAVAERAKRQLLYQVRSLGLRVEDRVENPENGLAFDLLSSRNQDVMTGHEDGIITLDLSESDAVHREFVRLQMGEPYRTVLGHMRHEIGHYFWPTLTADPSIRDEFRAKFGDEQLSYDEALDRHYRIGPPGDWPENYVSAYATMHPWEDWAETFAHYLHIQAGLETASSFGLETGMRTKAAARRSLEDGEHLGAITSMIQEWLTLTFGLNAMADALGQNALYPFVLRPAVVQKLDFVHRCVRAEALTLRASWPSGPRCRPAGRTRRGRGRCRTS